MNAEDKLKIIRAKIKLVEKKEQIKRAKAVQKFLKKPLTYKKILKPSERVGVVLNYQKQEPKSIKNFIDVSMIRRSDI